MTIMMGSVTTGGHEGGAVTENLCPDLQVQSTGNERERWVWKGMEF